MAEDVGEAHVSEAFNSNRKEEVARWVDRIRGDCAAKMSFDLGCIVWEDPRRPDSRIFRSSGHIRAGDPSPRSCAAEKVL